MSHVAFLRGMNLGKRRITNDDLRAHVEALGFEDVRTFRASGNVLFRARPGVDATATFEAGLAERLGYLVQTFVRSRDELAETLARVPFTDAERAAMGKPQVTFLRDAPDAAAVALAEAHSSDADRVVVHGRAWYWLPRQGISTSDLDFKAVERALGVGTTRTEGTCLSILKKLS